ncbi:MAG: bifunctional diaminohydroxyphosphoribosylaminopyrimidine deaminase/5-amino-6-(5-phosphoribosylamino)uracil reductase RibD [bacterium]|nr:bifunctional diaminohydroxyphosphoribosylaminopyrimidine deaminase/5-amino-6-(5-phosphoribosylamino)uracil reductase RibD [bacterium]
MMENKKYIELALQLARKAIGKTSPNPMVGAVVVKEGKIVGQGYHQKAGSPHAEINALLEAGSQSKGATLYLNLEPCSHYGRTPPCTKAIIEAGIKKVVVSMLDPNPLVYGKEELEKAGVEFEVGILKEEARKLNEVYVKYITTKLPFVILKSAVTLDGKITTPDKGWITSEQSRELVHQLRSQVDAVLVGKNTILADDPLLTARIKGAKDPFKIIVDTRLEISLVSRVLKNPKKVIIATTKDAPQPKVFTLEKSGARVLILPEDNGRVTIPKLMKRLGEMDLTSVLVEGGAQINASFLESGLVDKIFFFIAPKIAGNFQLSAVGNLSELVRLKELSVEKIGEDILISGYIRAIEDQK